MSLEARILVVRDGSRIEASFDVSAGTTMALLGPNGAGKSTVVGALAGIVPITEGRISLGGSVLDDTASGRRVPAERRPIGVVFQELLLFPRMSVLENVAFPLRARGASASDARDRALRQLDALGMADRVARFPDALSGGEAQRAALARALVHEPELLLLDEPLSAIDAPARRQLRVSLRAALSSFPGVRVLVTHDPAEAMTLADRIIILEAGSVTHDATPEEIRTEPRSSYAADLVGLNLFRGRLERLDDGAGRIAMATGEVVVGWPRDAEGLEDEVIGLLRPSDVTLHRERPEGSERNVFLGRVAGVSMDGERARVVLETTPPLVAEITIGSLRRMRIADGVEVWAAFKAVEVAIRA